MKKITINSLLFSVFCLTLIILGGCYPMGYGMMGQGYTTDYPSRDYGSSSGNGATPQQGYNWNYCPYCGHSFGAGSGYTMGPGMMGQGHGMMGRGYGYESQEQPPQRPMEESDALTIVENYLKSTRNPNLKLGSIMDKGTTFEVEILTQDNSIADRIAVDKNSGWIRSIY